MRIGLSGTNWTGKSTTIERFTAQYPGEHTPKVVSLTDLVEECPFPMNREQGLDGSKWMVDRMSEMLAEAPRQLQIFDRTPLDVMAFTAYAAYKEKRSAGDLLSRLQQMSSQFHHIFYLRPDPSWPVGVDPKVEDWSFALLIDHFMFRAFSEKFFNASAVPWAIPERLQLMNERVSE